MVSYDDNALQTISFYICTPIKINFIIADKFDRVCIEVDLTKSLVGQMVVDGKWQKMECEGLHVVYYHCGCYRHITKSCTIKI